MTTDLVVGTPSPPVAVSVDFWAMSPTQKRDMAVEIANVCAEIIDRQKLWVKVGAGKHVKIEGWLTLGTMLGITAREASVTAVEGGYEAKVELVSQATHHVLGAASAVCLRTESRWRAAEVNAIRSMAITRATAKAYRMNFAWIIALAGFDTTPAEEMDHVVVASSPTPEMFNLDNPVHEKRLHSYLLAAGIPEERWSELSAAVADGKTPLLRVTHRIKELVDGAR